MSSHIYTTRNRVRILTRQGSKSQFDFIVKYREPGKRERTPKHIHLINDLYMKMARNESLTMRLVDHIINFIILRVRSNNSMPPRIYPSSNPLAPDYLRDKASREKRGVASCRGNILSFPSKLHNGPKPKHNIEILPVSHYTTPACFEVLEGPSPYHRSSPSVPHI